jgi:hypothetical protein
LLEDALDLVGDGLELLRASAQHWSADMTRRRAMKSVMRERTATCPTKALVEATPISGPTRR